MQRRYRPLSLLLSLLALFIATGEESVANTPACAYLPEPSALQPFFEIVFSRTIATEGRTRAFEFKKAGHNFTTLEEINDYNVESTALGDPASVRVELEDAPMDSVYWRSVRSPEGAAGLVSALSATLASLRGGERTSPGRNLRALEKALMQRDLFHTFSIVDLAKSRLTSSASRAAAVEVQECIAGMLGAVLLLPREYDELVAMRPHGIPDAYSATPPRTLQESYLPLPVVRADASWFEIPPGVQPFKHFVDFGGRSFVRVYLRAPGHTPDQLAALWQAMYASYGRRLHMTAVKEKAPAGLESMLVRTFGVLLKDGTYRDSQWPEEVIIRILRDPNESVDLASSDFRGTLFYRYRLVRERLLASPASLGLRRVLDDDEQFFGFFGDVPDPQAYSNTTSTMRTNCIGCHSELYYGLSTIFSFERDPSRTSAGNSLLRTIEPGRYELLTAEMEHLKAWLNASFLRPTTIRHATEE